METEFRERIRTSTQKIKSKQEKNRKPIWINQGQTQCVNIKYISTQFNSLTGY